MIWSVIRRVLLVGAIALSVALSAIGLRFFGWAQLIGADKPGDQNLCLTVTTEGRKPGGLDQIVDVLKANCTTVDLRRVEESPDLLEASFLVGSRTSSS